jgi:hypothetical protein
LYISFSEISFFGLTYPFLGKGGKAQQKHLPTRPPLCLLPNADLMILIGICAESSAFILYIRLATSSLRGVLDMVTVYMLLWSCCYNKHQAESEMGEHLST